MGVSSFDVIKANHFIGPGQSEATTGQVYYVNSGTGAIAPRAIGGSDGNDGLSPKTPFATLDYAIGKCVANRGDTIYVMPGHWESLTASNTITIDVDGISIIGLGNDGNQPQFQFDHATAIISHTADDTYLKNLRFTTSVADVAVGLDLTANTNNTIDSCTWDFDATGLEFTAMLYLHAAANYVTVKNCKFLAESIDGAGSALLIDDCTHVTIANNVIFGDFNSVAIDGAAASSACTDYVIVGNVIRNFDTGAAVDLDDAATGIVAANLIGGGAALAGNVDFGNCWCVENYVADAVDVHGVELPASAAE